MWIQIPGLLKTPMECQYLTIPKALHLEGLMPMR